MKVVFDISVTVKPYKGKVKEENECLVIMTFKKYPQSKFQRLSLISSSTTYHFSSAAVSFCTTKHCFFFRVISRTNTYTYIDLTISILVSSEHHCDLPQSQVQVPKFQLLLMLILTFFEAQFILSCFVNLFLFSSFISQS